MAAACRSRPSTRATIARRCRSTSARAVAERGTDQAVELSLGGARQHRPDVGRDRVSRQGGAEQGQRVGDRPERGGGGEGRGREHAAVHVGDGLGAGELAGPLVHRQPDRRRREDQRHLPGGDLAREERVPLLVLPQPGARSGTRRRGRPPWPDRAPAPVRGPARAATTASGRRRWGGGARRPPRRAPGTARAAAPGRSGRKSTRAGSARSGARASLSVARSGTTSPRREPDLARERGA